MPPQFHLFPNVVCASNLPPPFLLRTVSPPLYKPLSPFSFFPCRSLLVKTSLLVKLPTPSNIPPLPSWPVTPSFTPSWTASTFLSPMILVLSRLSGLTSAPPLLSGTHSERQVGEACGTGQRGGFDVTSRKKYSKRQGNSNKRSLPCKRCWN